MIIVWQIVWEACNREGYKDNLVIVIVPLDDLSYDLYVSVPCGFSDLFIQKMFCFIYIVLLNIYSCFNSVHYASYDMFAV